MSGELTGCQRRRIMPACALAFLMLAPGGPAALANAAAGNAAFEKGDYVRAMAEWAGAAERGDADAEFGLGMLYERGDGAVKQSYKDADKWYRKAAEHDHIGAQYRLALIWSAGTDEFPPDLVEAYKWIVLASERGLATEVKALLETIIDKKQQAEGQKRAAKWKEEQEARKKPPPPAATVPAAAPGAAPPPVPSQRAAPTPAAAGKSGGCPGWPFPTLPCTEQFPALPGVPPARAPALAPPRAPGPN